MQNLTERDSSIRLKMSTLKTLRSLKKDGQSYDDVIRALVNQEGKKVQGNITSIQYRRKVGFVQTHDIGIEFEYNDVEGFSEYTFDIEITKVYQNQEILNPSVFFGGNKIQYQQLTKFKEMYFTCLLNVLHKNTGILVQKYVKPNQFLDKNIKYTTDPIHWRKMYIELNISLTSFEDDVMAYLSKAQKKLSR